MRDISAREFEFPQSYANIRPSGGLTTDGYVSHAPPYSLFRLACEASAGTPTCLEESCNPSSNRADKRLAHFHMNIARHHNT
jgi:hypothetical protein